LASIKNDVGGGFFWFKNKYLAKMFLMNLVGCGKTAKIMLLKNISIILDSRFHW